MPEGTVQEAVAENAAQISYVKEQIFCRVCGSDEMRRVLRLGILQENIFPMFGYFPWRCMKCGTQVILRKRHRRKLQDRAE